MLIEMKINNNLYRKQHKTDNVHVYERYEEYPKCWEINN
jgi:hypothetical protein